MRSHEVILKYHSGFGKANLCWRFHRVNAPTRPSPNIMRIFLKSLAMRSKQVVPTATLRPKAFGRRAAFAVRVSCPEGEGVEVVKARRGGSAGILTRSMGKASVG
jgi:hypothetical protein